MRKAFDRAKVLGIKIIVLGSGGARKVPDGFSQDEAWKQLVEFAKRIAPEAKKRGIVVAVEPLQKGETNTINTAAEGLKWVKAVNHPNFQLMVDFYHLSLEKEDPAILVSAKRNIKHIHIANPAGRKFPLTADEFDYSKFFADAEEGRLLGRHQRRGTHTGLRRRGAQGAGLPALRLHRGGEAPVGPDARGLPRGRRWRRQAGHPDQHRARPAGRCRAAPAPTPAPAK